MPGPLGPETGRSAGIRRVVFSPDGKYLLVSGTGMGLWEVEAARRVWFLQDARFDSGDRPDVPGDGPVISPDGRRVAWPGRQGAAGFPADGFAPNMEGTGFELRDAPSGRLLRRFSHGGPMDFGAMFAMSPDWRVLASAGSDDVVRLWEVETGKLHATLQHGQNSPMALAWSPDGKLVALMCMPMDRRTVRSPLGVVMSSTGRAAGNMTVRIWDAQSGSERGAFEGGGFPSWLAFSPDSKLLAAPLATRGLVICDVETRKVKQTVRNFPADMAAFTAEGEDLVCCQSFTSAARRGSPAGPRPLVLGRVNLATGKSRAVCQRRWGGEAASEPLACVAISPDGGMVAAPDPGGKVALLDSSSGKPRQVLQGLEGRSPACLAISPGAARVAEGTEQGEVIVWILSDSAPLPAETPSHAPPSALRRWTSVDGKFSVEAQLLRIDGDAVVLKKKGGSEVQVPLEKLSQEDREYAARHRRPAIGRPPGKAREER